MLVNAALTVTAPILAYVTVNVLDGVMNERKSVSNWREGNASEGLKNKSNDGKEQNSAEHGVPCGECGWGVCLVG